MDGLSAEDAHNIQTGDQYRQSDRYRLLWDTINKSGIISDASKARSFITNLYRCQFNIILSEEDSTNYSIEYFLDVNLKGIKNNIILVMSNAPHKTRSAPHFSTGAPHV